MQLHNAPITTLVLPAAVYVAILAISECRYALANDLIPLR